MAHTRNVSNGIGFYVQLLIGAVLGAAGLVFFLAPADIAPAGVAGLALLLREVIGTPIGLVTILFNIPIMYLGYRLLPGGWSMVAHTMLAVVVYSVVVDGLLQFADTDGLSDDRMLNAIFGGIVGGVGAGLIYRNGVNFGGTSTLALILQRRLGMPLSTATLYTDTVVIAAAGLVFGVEGALYATMVLFISSASADYVMEGPSVIRVVFIITDRPTELSTALMQYLYRGVTAIEARGMYTGRDRAMLYVTILRSQVRDLTSIVEEIDERAFVVIGQGHSAYGGGFRTMRNGKAASPVPEPMPDSVLAVEGAAD